MDTWERTKFGIAIGGVAFAFLALHWVGDYVFPESAVVIAGYKVAGVSELPVDLASLQRSWPAGMRQQGGRTNVRDFMANIEKVSVPRSAEPAPVAAAPEPVADLGTLLAAADPAKGKQTAQVCTTCHSFDPNQDRIGPSLYGVVGRGVATRKATFSYSSAFAAQTGVWTYERLDHYLTNPAKAVPGNKMGFVGLRKAEDRANVIAFLSTLSASRVPFPKPEPKTAATGKAGGGASASRG